MQVNTIHYNAFRKHANMYLEPLVIWKWKREQELMFKRRHSKKIILGGDMRADSPGQKPLHFTIHINQLINIAFLLCYTTVH